MSNYYRSAACEEIKDKQGPYIDLLPMLHLSISNASADTQITPSVIKVSGTITVSF